jgi:RNA polymerase sigma-70 factor (ECF subfamily)
LGSPAYVPNWEDSVEADCGLVRRARAGDQDAFGEIVRAYQRKVYGVALRMTRRHEVADDIAQETFIRAYRNLGRFELGRPLAPWLTKIATNLAINHLTGVARREQSLYTEGQPEGPQKTSSSGTTDCDPLSVLESRDRMAALERAMDQLSPEHRAVLILKVDEGMRYQEIAETLEISQGTVMSRLFRARQKLKELLAEYL